MSFSGKAAAVLLACLQNKWVNEKARVASAPEKIDDLESRDRWSYLIALPIRAAARSTTSLLLSLSLRGLRETFSLGFVIFLSVAVGLWRDLFEVGLELRLRFLVEGLEDVFPRFAVGFQGEELRIIFCSEGFDVGGRVHIRRLSWNGDHRTDSYGNWCWFLGRMLGDLTGQIQIYQWQGFKLIKRRSLA